jgi:hypothetical protein
VVSKSRIRRYDVSRSAGSPPDAAFVAARFPVLFPVLFAVPFPVPFTAPFWARLLVLAPDVRCVFLVVFAVVFFRVLADARVTFRAGFRWGLMLRAVPGRASGIRSAPARVSRS